MKNLSTSGTGIRTPTYRVRVCCATFTQYRCFSDGLYYSRCEALCQGLDENFFGKCKNAEIDAEPTAGAARGGREGENVGTLHIWRFFGHDFRSAARSEGEIRGQTRVLERFFQFCAFCRCVENFGKILCKSSKDRCRLFTLPSRRYHTEFGWTRQYNLPGAKQWSAARFCIRKTACLQGFFGISDRETVKIIYACNPPVRRVRGFFAPIRARPLSAGR